MSVLEIPEQKLFVTETPIFYRNMLIVVMVMVTNKIYLCEKQFFTAT